ncbi:hypothetical protein [Staphylococcus hyicus]|uniref:hypothetical protein n=1 Tax=Staphylococcus hyicus TaxID=1284 RepID=UPI0031330B14
MVKKNEVKIVTEQQTTNFELNNDEKVFVEVSNYNGTINIRRINDLKIYDPKPLNTKDRVKTGYKNSSIFKSSIDETTEISSDSYQPSIVRILSNNNNESYSNDYMGIVESNNVVEKEPEETSSERITGEIIEQESNNNEIVEIEDKDDDIDGSDESQESSLKHKYFPIDEDE